MQAFSNLNSHIWKHHGIIDGIKMWEPWTQLGCGSVKDVYTFKNAIFCWIIFSFRLYDYQ